MANQLWSDERIDWTVLGARWSGDKRTDAVRAKLLMVLVRDEYEALLPSLVTRNALRRAMVDAGWTKSDNVHVWAWLDRLENT